MITLSSCGGSKSSYQGPTDNLLQTSSFQLYYRKDWSEVVNEIPYATVYSIDSLKLVSFSRAPGEGTGKTVLSFKDTNKKFKEIFLAGGNAEKVKTENGIEVEVIKYQGLTKSYIFPLTAQSGTVALWDNGKTSYALIDQIDMHQADGGFESVYQTFKYLK